MPFIGFDWRYRNQSGEINFQEQNLFGQKNTKDNRALVSLGVNYTLPMLIRFQTEVFINGNFRMQLEREDIPVSKRLRGMFMINTDKEYMVGLDYIFTRNLRTRLHYDSDMGLGFGLTLNY